MEYRVEFKLAINNKEAIGLKMNHLTAEKLLDAKRQIEAILAQHYTEPEPCQPCQPTQPECGACGKEQVAKAAAQLDAQLYAVAEAAQQASTLAPPNPMEAIKVPTMPTSCEPPAPSKPGTKGLIFVSCSSCGDRFVTFAKEPVTEHICTCGHTIDLDPCKLAHFEFVCPDCGKRTYGYTNDESAGFWMNCVCGKKVELEWRNKTKSYHGKAE